jgi:hypothetical protein
MKSHKEKINELITLEKDNNLINHILTSFFKRGETIAEKKTHQYILWTSNYWVGSFYPVFKISFNKENQISQIKTELSLSGKFWVIILGSLILSLLSFLLIIPMIEDFKYLDFTALIILGIYGLLIYGIYWVFKRIYLNETKYLLNELRVSVGLETQENIDRIEQNKKEWTFKRTLIRLILYPFSMFGLMMSIVMLFQGKLKGLFGIFIIVAYLYTDLKIIIDKRKKAKVNSL